MGRPDPAGELTALPRPSSWWESLPLAVPLSPPEEPLPALDPSGLERLA